MNQAVDKVYSTIKSKDFRNIFILVIAVLSVLAINSLLPLLEGTACYTEQVEEMSYLEYLNAKEEDQFFAMTFTSKEHIKKLKENVEVTEDIINTTTVKVYTKFFFQSITWWANMALSALSVILIYYACFNFILSKLKRKRKDYTDLKDEVSTAVQNQVDPITFEPWNERFNTERKIKQHVSNIKYAKDKLIHKTSYKVKHNDKLKRHSKYKQKIEEFDNQLTAEYLDTYVKDKKVKNFKYIYPTFVMSGYNSIGNTVDSYSLIRSDSSRISKDGTKKILISIMLTVVLAVLLTFTVDASIDKPWYWILINIIAKITPLIVQVALAFDYAETFVEEQLVPNLISRRSIILLYLAGTKNGEQNR